MTPIWQAELTRIVYIALFAATAGWLSGSVAWALVTMLAIYVIFALRFVRRLDHWLEHNASDEPPESWGIWGHLFDKMYRHQRRYQQQQQRLTEIINKVQRSSGALRDAVVMIDQHGSLEWWNRAAEGLLGFRHPSDKGQALTNLLRDPRFISYYDKQDYQDPLVLASPMDDNIVLEYQITIFGRNERLMLVRNITRLYRLEQMRKDFVANVSHELRTPLTVINGYLETFADYSDQLPPRWGRATHQMQQQSRRMQNIINDLLLLSRLETTDIEGQQQYIEIDLMLDSIRQDAQLLSGDKEHRITTDLRTDARVIGSENELRSAISNLVFNAVKYTPPGSTIKMIWQELPHNKGAVLAVEDNGEGIDARHLPRLTERFYRVDKGRSAETGGTGLGLAIVKHVLLRHNAKLDIKSEVGKGTQFSCTFPDTSLAMQGESTREHSNTVAHSPELSDLAAQPSDNFRE
ncbi:phosphate regulon sensor histidine kinase PhoR [Oceanospirillum linum]|uniref:phosphate regulon sensor histidine kinase PhoR n=1 Tax=Oceanospirillum linum TaxID=966 RepID=UPI00089F2E5D|nr:phosphate regulon sensor histidine kinase PhoR [Oceanospirillum linum]SEF81926.1 PAS/PAC sensor signal transduction histidine kinase [Oleiphilus messinensis]SMP19174.1 PAS/PAC sensor signal transduction histidine kinase [Oceanospirillum linum]